MKFIIPMLLLASCVPEDRPRLQPMSQPLVYELLSEDLAIVRHSPDVKVGYYRTSYQQENICPDVKRKSEDCLLGEIEACIVNHGGKCLSWTCKHRETEVKCKAYFRKILKKGALDKGSSIYRGRTDYGTFVRIDMNNQYEFYGTFSIKEQK